MLDDVKIVELRCPAEVCAQAKRASVAVGFDRHLVKPVTEAQLMDVIRSVGERLAGG